MNHIKAIIADNQRLFVEGFKSILSELDTHTIEILATVNSAEALFDKLNYLQADIIFLELNLPDEDGFSLLPKLREEFPNIRVCVITCYTDHKFVKSAFQVGADGFYSKLNDSAELSDCLTNIMLGNRFLSDGLYITPPPKSRKVIIQENGKLEDRFLMRQKLTRREQEILNLITKAMNNKEIAEQLYISDQTVGVHRKNIMRKLGVRNTVNLIKFALDYQLV